jgi:hypothetical protein
MPNPEMQLVWPLAVIPREARAKLCSTLEPMAPTEESLSETGGASRAEASVTDIAVRPA